jgi:hypothetical protein
MVVGLVANSTTITSEANQKMQIFAQMAASRRTGRATFAQKNDLTREGSGQGEGKG